MGDYGPPTAAEIEARILMEVGIILRLPPGTDNKDVGETISEWRIYVGPSTIVKTTPEFEPKHFRRNNAAGESVVPMDVYIALLKRIVPIGNRSLGVWDRVVVASMCSLFFYFVTGFPVLVLLILPDNNQDIEGWEWYAIVGITVVSTTIFIWFMVIVKMNLDFSREYTSIDHQMVELVKDTYREYEESYGISIGYHPYENTKMPCACFPFTPAPYDVRPYIWLKGLHHQQAEVDEGGGDTLVNEIEFLTYPPMFITTCGILGEISVHEKRYHPSTGYDKDTWTLLTNTHKKYTELNHTLSRLFGRVVFLCFMVAWVVYIYLLASVDQPLQFVYGICTFFLAFIGGIVLGLASPFLFRLFDYFWIVPVYKRVAKEVTDTLHHQQREGPMEMMKVKPVLAVKYENSPTGPIDYFNLSRRHRYEIVKSQPSAWVETGYNTTDDTESKVDGISSNDDIPDEVCRAVSINAHVMMKNGFA
jgi:hypothetical protein